MVIDSSRYETPEKEKGIHGELETTRFGKEAAAALAFPIGAYFCYNLFSLSAGLERGVSLGRRCDYG